MSRLLDGGGVMMVNSRFFLIVALLFSLSSQAHSPPVEVTTPTGAKINVYEDTTPWKTADGKKFSWKNANGKKTVLALFYTSCRSICPMTVDSMKSIEKELGESAKDVQFVLISIDEKYDKPGRLKRFARQNKINHWTLLSGKTKDVRNFAAKMGLGFQDKPGNEDLHQMHSRAFTFVDKKGTIIGTLPSFESDYAKAKELLK